MFFFFFFFLVLARALAEFANFPNVHDIAEIGVHPRRWDELTGDWEHRDVQFALPQPGPPGGPLCWGSDFVVLVLDAHNGRPHHYTGL